MSSNEDGILALLAKGLRDLRNQVGHLARQPGPAGRKGDLGPEVCEASPDRQAIRVLAVFVGTLVLLGSLT